MSSLTERIVDALLSRKLLTKAQLEEALGEQRAHGGSLQAILTKRGLVNEADLLSVVSQGLGIPPISLARLTIDPALKALISRELAIEYQVIPISRIGQALTIAMADPLNILALDTLTTLTGFSITSVLASAGAIREAIETYYGFGMEETLRAISEKAEAESLHVIQGAVEGPPDTARLLSLADEAPVIKYTDSLLQRAVKARASDLLIEPLEKTMRVRYRVDGVLQDGPAPPSHLRAAIVSRLKVMSELDIAERRLPQDGHLSVQVDERAVDFRISTLPTVLGEKVALRVLDTGRVELKLDGLGFRPGDLERLTACTRKPHGMILATGPTGAGKTTTLYALLKLVDTPGKNIVTVEDPVEFDLEGINQVSARPDVGLTFAKALRSILRQDPDVIMVGEIRDGETADMAVKSALTGHLVLSTLHTNTAAASIVRLINMGVEPFLITSCLMAVVGQRLVRKVCPRCVEISRPSPAVADRFGLLDDTGHPLPIARAKGCTACLQTGYQGREVLAEVLTVTPTVRKLILQHVQEHEIEAAACKAGMRRMRDHGLEKVRAHLTTLEEVVRVTTGEVVG